MMGWQWQQLEHMQMICTLVQKITITTLCQSIFTTEMPFLMVNQQHKSTEGKSQRIQSQQISKLCLKHDEL